MSTPLAADQPADGETRPAAPDAAERRLGPYKVLREIGHGGMGVVFLAARADDQYRKRVAIKVIPTGHDSPEAIRHFRRERQILASLDHPSIAKLLDGGTTDDGRPYLVMEYIEGEVITRYCDKHKHSVGERLNLFQKVCVAVAHAHRNLVVHRDLKPANVLVTAEGTPKLLDFGIAGFLNPELSGETVGGTRQALTPEYASPEQIQDGVVTTASDVYSLGVVLYELLTGRSPYRIRTHTTAELFKAVCEQDPDRPSTAVSRVEAAERAPDQNLESERKEGVNQARLRRSLSGDLDTILLKALRKEPAQRYSSVEAFAEDIRRHLEGHPVTARRPTMAYRTRKFVGRNWLAVSVAGAAVVLVLSSAIALAVQAQRLEQERNKSQQIATFLKDLFRVSTPSQSRGNTVTAREILDQGVKNIETTLAGDSATRADLLSTMGEVYLSLGLYAESERLVRQSLDLHRHTLGEEHEVTQRDVAGLAYVLHDSGRSKEALAIAAPALALQQRTLGDDHPVTRLTKRALGLAYVRLGRVVEAEPLMLQSVEADTRLLGRDHEETLKSLNNLAVLYQAQERLNEAITLDEEVLAHRRRRLGDTHPLTVGSINNLAFRYGTVNRFDEARKLLQEALVLGERTLGPDHPTFGTVLHSLGEIELATGNFAAADQRLRSALKIYRLQPGHRHLPLVLYQLAQVSAERTRRDEAFDLLEQAAQAGHFQGKSVDLRNDPHLSSLGTDPRLRAFEARAATDGDRNK